MDAGLQQRQKMLENQVQAADRDLKSMANKLMRTATFQVENAANKLQIAKSMETVAANVLTTNGLNDVSRVWVFENLMRIALQIVGLKSMIECINGFSKFTILIQNTFRC